MMQEGSKTIIEGLSNSRKKRPLFDLLVLRAGYNQDLHDAILKGDQKFLDKYIKNYPDKEELSWYTDEPIKITKKMKDEVKLQDEEITRSLKESQRIVIEACINESDDYKIVKKTEHGYPHYEIYKNNKFISSEDTREEAEKEIERLKQGIDEDEWKTMKGAHILINTDGDIIAGGPKSIRKEASKDEIKAGVQSANAKSKEENKK